MIHKLFHHIVPCQKVVLVFDWLKRYQLLFSDQEKDWCLECEKEYLRKNNV